MKSQHKRNEWWVMEEYPKQNDWRLFCSRCHHTKWNNKQHYQINKSWWMKWKVQRDEGTVGYKSLIRMITVIKQHIISLPVVKLLGALLMTDSIRVRNWLESPFLRREEEGKSATCHCRGAVKLSRTLRWDKLSLVQWEQSRVSGNYRNRLYLSPRFLPTIEPSPKTE